MGGFFSTAANQSDLILRLKDGLDNAEPSTNGLSARNLNRLGAMLEDEEYRTQAKRTLHSFEAEILQHPFLFVGLLDAVVVEQLGIRTLVITGSGKAVDDYVEKLRSGTPWGRTMVKLGEGIESKWLQERNMLIKAMDPNKAGVQLCEAGSCKEVLEA